MRYRLLSVLLMCALPLVLTSCKGGEPQQSPSSGQGEPQTAVPKGHGVLTILVQDEAGKPLEGAEIRIANKKGEAYKTKSRKDGTTKGAGPVSDNPYLITVLLTGYEAQQAQGIALSEVQPVFISVRLKRADK